MTPEMGEFHLDVWPPWHQFTALLMHRLSEKCIRLDLMTCFLTTGCSYAQLLVVYICNQLQITLDSNPVQILMDFVLTWSYELEVDAIGLKGNEWEGQWLSKVVLRHVANAFQIQSEFFGLRPWRVWRGDAYSSGCRRDLLQNPLLGTQTNGFHHLIPRMTSFAGWLIPIPIPKFWSIHTSRKERKSTNTRLAA